MPLRIQGAEGRGRKRTPRRRRHRLGLFLGRGGPDPPKTPAPFRAARGPYHHWWEGKRPGDDRANPVWVAPGSASRPQRLKFVDLEGVAGAGAGANNTRSFRRRALQFTQLSPSLLLN